MLYFIFRTNMKYISYLVQMMFSRPGSVMLAVLTSNFIGAFFDFYIGSGARHSVYVFSVTGNLLA